MEEIRVGLLLEDGKATRWVQRMLELVVAVEGVKLVLVIKITPGTVPGRPIWRRIFEQRSQLLYCAWRKLDRYLFHRQPDAFQSVELSPLLRDVPAVNVVPEATRFSDHIAPADLKEIAAYRLDVLIDATFRVLGGGIINAARCGVWSFHLGDNLANRGENPGAWEVLFKESAISSMLGIRAEGLDGELALTCSWLPADLTSTERNLQNLYWQGIAFVSRQLRLLQRLGPEAFLQRARERDPIPYFNTKRFYGIPKNAVTLWLLCLHAWRFVVRRVKEQLWFQQWVLLYEIGAPETVPLTVSRYRLLRPPKDRFWADPCAVECNGRYVIFMEELIYRRGSGHIATIEFDDQGEPQLPPRKVLERPYHLSYPFVFEYQGAWYMIPETMQNRTIELYRCAGFPDRWEFVMNLMNDISAVDATFWVHAGRCWLFATVCEHDQKPTWDDLFLFSADHLLSSEWKSHPQNPVVSDIRMARPAGAIFEYNGQWYRPAQDCGSMYGRAIVLNRIDLITEDAYRETPVSRLDPDWDERIIGTHTLSRAGHLTCIDGFMQRRK